MKINLFAKELMLLFWSGRQR